MDCACHTKSNLNAQLLQKLASMEQELVVVAKSMLKTASDPVSGVIRFLAERPGDATLPGYLVNKVLLETFGDKENIPGLVRILAGHVREIIRQSNVIDIINEHPTVECWGGFVIKQTERIKFEVGLEKGKVVLNNIKGLFGIEHGIEAPLDKILVSPPKLIVTVRLGLLRPQRTVDM